MQERSRSALIFVPPLVLIIILGGWFITVAVVVLTVLAGIEVGAVVAGATLVLPAGATMMVGLAQAARTSAKTRSAANRSIGCLAAGRATACRLMPTAGTAARQRRRTMRTEPATWCAAATRP